MLRRFATLSLAAACACGMFGVSAGAAAAEEPVPCEVKDSPEVERPDQGTVILHLRTEVVCFGAAVVTPGD